MRMVWILLLVAGCAGNAATGAQAADTSDASAPAAAAAAPGGALAADASVDQVLDALDARGDGLKDFTADVKLEEVDEAVGNAIVRVGKIWLQKLEGDDARLRLTLDKKTVKEKTIDEKLEYVYAGGWLIDRDYRRKINVRRQVVRPGEKINLLKLGQGPLPLPLGQDKADVHKMFEVKKVDSRKDDPANATHLELTPRKGGQFAKKFDVIDFWIDRATAMPVRVRTTEADQIKTWDLTNINVNAGLGDKDFVLTNVDEKEWQLREEPFE
jgi:hypothetical protein